MLRTSECELERTDMILKSHDFLPCVFLDLTTRDAQTTIGNNSAEECKCTGFRSEPLEEKRGRWQRGAGTEPGVHGYPIIRKAHKSENAYGLMQFRCGTCKLC